MTPWKREFKTWRFMNAFHPIHKLKPRVLALSLVFAACTITTTCLSAPAEDTAGPTKPNVVIFHTHDIGQYLHCYGVKTVRTPNLDKFAEQGVRFARSFCTQPGCSPSRASLFTGRYPHNNGVMGLTHANFGWDLRPEEKHLAQFLKEAGYATVAIGVIHETHSGAKRCGYDRHIKKNLAAEGTTAGIEELKATRCGQAAVLPLRGLH